MEKLNDTIPYKFLIRHRHGRPGLSYVEVLLASVILSVLIASAVQLFGNLARSQAVITDQDGASFLALEMAREISRCYYFDPNSNRIDGIEADEAGPDRRWYDDLDDYNEWQTSPPVDRLGTPYKTYAHLTRGVEVYYVAANDFSQVVGADEGFRGITITVSDGPKMLAEHKYVIPNIIPPYYITK